MHSWFFPRLLRVGAVLLCLLLIGGISGCVGRATPADPCHMFSGHQICAVSLRRSAQRYWEYRTVVSIDGVKQPLEVYNCRDRTRTLARDGSIIPFLTDKTGDWVCQLFKPSRGPQLDERISIDIR